MSSEKLHSAPSRSLTRLNRRTERNLRSYAVAAGAAGVSALALAHPAEGKIIFTPTKQTIAPNTTLNIDLNKDGITDFAISNHYFIGTPIYQGYQGQVRVFGMNATNEVVGTSFESASALLAGAKIGAKDRFKGLEMVSCKADEHSGAYRFGQWINVKIRFLGFSFKINGQTHFGWARISLKQVTFCQSTGILTGYAYETVVNRTIIAGQTSSSTEVSGIGNSDSTNRNEPPSNLATLGALALGAPALTIWRREENMADTYKERVRESIQ
jgi:hypothetical protein